MKFQPTSGDLFLARKNGLIVTMTDEQYAALYDGGEEITRTLGGRPVRLYFRKNKLFAKTSGTEGMGEIQVELQLWAAGVYRVVPIELAQKETA